MKIPSLLYFILLNIYPAMVFAETLGIGDSIRAPDNHGSISRLMINNVRTRNDVGSQQSVLVFAREGLGAFVAYAYDQGRNLAAWTGSSKFMFVVTGESKEPEMELVYKGRDNLEGQSIDLTPLIDYGEKVLPSGPGSIPHDSIEEIQSSDGDAIRCLYYRAKFPKRFVVPVRITIKDGNDPKTIITDFGKCLWMNEWDTDLPPLSSLEDFRQSTPPLFSASESGNADDVSSLLASGADPNTLDWSKVSALQVAVTNNHLEAAEALINKGADVNYQLRGKPEEGGIGTALQMAAGKASPALLRLLFSHGAEAGLEIRGPFGYTPIFVAVMMGKLDNFDLLLSKGANLDVKADGAATPLMVAVQNLQVELVKRIIDLRPRSINDRSDSGYTALGMAKDIKGTASSGAAWEPASVQADRAKRAEDILDLLVRAGAAQ